MFNEDSNKEALDGALQVHSNLNNIQLKSFKKLAKSYNITMNIGKGAQSRFSKLIANSHNT